MTSALAAIPTLTTDRLTLRGWRPEDLGPLTVLLSDADHARFIGPMTSRGDIWRRMAAFVGHWTLRGFGVWAVCERQSQAFVGWCGLWFPEEWPEPEIGWALLQEKTGRGYATEAASAARDYAYRDLGWTTAISFIDLENAPSRRVAERLGARFEQILLLHGSEAGVFRYPAPPEMINP